MNAASTLTHRWFSHLDDRFPSGSYDLNSRAQTVCEPLQKVDCNNFTAWDLIGVWFRVQGSQCGVWDF